MFRKRSKKECLLDMNKKGIQDKIDKYMNKKGIYKKIMYKNLKKSFKRNPYLYEEIIDKNYINKCLEENIHFELEKFIDECGYGKFVINYLLYLECNGKEDVGRYRDYIIRKDLREIGMILHV